MVSDDVVTAPDVLSIQNPKPAQHPRIDVDRTSESGRSKNFVSTLKGKAKLVDKARCSEDKLLFAYFSQLYF